MGEDVYFKKTVTFNFWKHSLKFGTSQDLFSSHEIDAGTRLLLRTIVETPHWSPDYHLDVLDMGCGYGPLGLTIKALFPGSIIHMVDRDALAIEYTRQNAEINELESIEAYGSLGYDDLRAFQFDLIVSNIPGKAGEKVVSYLLQEAACFLKPNGIVAVVVVAPLTSSIEGELERASGCEIVLKKSNSTHSVFHYRFVDKSPRQRPQSSALDREIYLRKNLQFKFGTVDYFIQTAWGIPEFDYPSHTTRMALEALPGLRNSRISKAVVFNPGQGYLAVALSRFLQPSNIILVDRDLLALRYSRMNLINNGTDAGEIGLFHQVGLGIAGQDPVDLFCIMLKEEEGPEAHILTIKQALQTASSNATIVAWAGSTPITRLETNLKILKPLHIKKRLKSKGVRLLILERG